MKNKIKELRVRIDGLAQLTKELKPQSQYRLNLSEIPESLSADDAVEIFNRTGYSIGRCITPLPQCFKELEKATDSLYLAKAWLGKILGELGSETPYENDGNRKTVEDIEPVADTKKEIKFPMNHHLTEGLDVKHRGKELSHIEKVDWLREQIKDIINNTEDFSETIDYVELEQGLVYKYLCEARFWLGFELGRIKESN